MKSTGSDYRDETRLVHMLEEHSNYDDAVHIATAAVHGMDYLVTWNCRHIANVYTKPLIYRCCLANGFKSAEICTPPEMEGDDENV